MSKFNKTKLTAIKDEVKQDYRLLIDGYILGSEHFTTFDEAVDEVERLIKAYPDIYERETV